MRRSHTITTVSVAGRARGLGDGNGSKYPVRTAVIFLISSREWQPVRVVSLETHCCHQHRYVGADRKQNDQYVGDSRKESDHQHS